MKIHYVQLTGWPYKTPRRERCPYTADYDVIKEQLLRELRARAAKNVQVRMFLSPAFISAETGLPKADAPLRPRSMTNMHPGVVVAFTSGMTGAELEFPACRFPTWKDNLRAVAQTLERLRFIERDGVGMGQEQYKGYQLEKVVDGTVPAATVAPVPPVETVLTVEKAARELLNAAKMERTPQAILGLMTLPDYRNMVYNKAVKIVHPDHGGTSAQFIALHQAYQTLGGDA